MRKQYDFSDAKRAKDVPHLTKFHQENSGKTRITIMLDNVVLGAFREQAEAEGIGYQTLINQALLDSLGGDKDAQQVPLTEEQLRKILREELKR